MLPPIVLGLGALGLAYGAYEKFVKKAPVQAQLVTGTGGVPLQIVTLIAKSVSLGQARGVASPPAPSPAPHAPALAQAQVVPGQGTVYAPPKMVDVSSPGQIQLAPIIISSTGASSVAIGGVLDVQRALNTLGFKPALKEDGKFGPATSSNIRQFQSKVGLVVDGNAGPAVKAGLSNALAAFVSGGPQAPIAKQATLAAATGKPSSVVTAKDVQHALNLLGAKPPLQEDGKAGPKTVAAIKSFQLSHGLVVDGVAGAKTKAALAIAATGPVQVSGQFAGTFG